MARETVSLCAPPGRAKRHMSLTFFFALAVTVTWQMPQTAAQSGRHGDGHAEHHGEYQNWKQPNGLSCCNDQDCRPTRAYLTDDGWRAWNGQRWLLVPPERVLPTDFAGDGRSHICEARDRVFCFTPGQVRG